jgi:hypothetical protein
MAGIINAGCGAALPADQYWRKILEAFSFPRWQMAGGLLY